MREQDKMQSRYDALENNPRKKKLIFGGLIVFLSLIFLGGIALGLVDILGTEGKLTPPYTPVFVLQEPDSAESAKTQLGELLQAAKQADSESRAKLKVSTSFSIDENSISDDREDAMLDEILIFVKNDILDKVKDDAYTYSSLFNEDFSDVLLTPSFEPDTVLSFGWDLLRDNEGNQKAGTEDQRELRIVFQEEPFPTEEDALYQNFNLGNAQASFTKMREASRDILTVTNSEIICRGFEIRSEFDAVKNMPNLIEYKRNYAITLTLAFRGKLAELGERTISFVLNVNEKYEFIYAGLRLSQNVLWMKKGETLRLEAYITADERFDVIWSSSDSEIATVDEEGYVKGRAISDKPVTVTAVFTYLGNTYAQDCTVYVRKPLEEIKLTEKELTMKPGETHALTVEFKPEKATVKDLIWLSEDESIATVDENGLITAVGDGTVIITAVALDGNYKSTCTLTVKDGENNG